jgi:site-specific recombinase XerD
LSAQQLIPPRGRELLLPPLVAGSETSQTESLLEQFYRSMPQMVEAWVNRRQSAHTRRAYREDLMTFARWLAIPWPRESHRFLGVSVLDVQAYRQWLVESGAAPKTINRRISSLSSFYRYVGACAAELRLPVTIPNPAHAQFIARAGADPRQETRALSSSAARHLMSLPQGASVEALRDRALLKVFLYTGIRLATARGIEVEDFFWDGAEATLRLREKGEKHRTIGLHVSAAQAIRDYVEQAGLRSGPLFRPLREWRGRSLADRPMSAVCLYSLLRQYLKQLPGGVREVSTLGGGTRLECPYTPHSLRATTATLLLNAGVDITKVQALLGHRHITTTQIYDKRRRATSDSASHEVPL